MHDGPPSSRPDHPTGGRRATQKSPPVVSSGAPAGGEGEVRESVPFDPPEPVPGYADEDMESVSYMPPQKVPPDDPMEIDEESIVRVFGSLECFVASRFADEPVEDLLKSWCIRLI